MWDFKARGKEESIISIKNQYKDPLVKEKNVSDRQKSMDRSQSHRIGSREYYKSRFQYDYLRM